MIARVVRPALVRRLYADADGVVAVSHGAGQSVRDAVTGLRVPVQVIPNPILVPSLYEQARAPLNDPWFGEGALPVLLAVGRLAPQKDMATLVRAFAQVRPHVRARLLILGEGEERPRLEGLVRDLGLAEDVRLPGFVPNPYPYMAAVRGLVLSSRFEGAPTVLVEALALGTPVASTDCPSGPREILENGRWGRLVGVGDHAALAAAMLEILAGSPYPSPGPRDLARYHLDHAVERYLAVVAPEMPRRGPPGEPEASMSC